MGSVFGYIHISFSENLRTIVHCVKAFASWLHLEGGFVLFIKNMFEYIIQD